MVSRLAVLTGVAAYDIFIDKGVHARPLVQVAHKLDSSAPSRGVL